MTGMWSTIKSAAPPLGRQHESPPPPMDGSTGQSPSPPRKLGTPSSSRSLPRPPSSLDARATTQSQATTTSHAHPPSPSTKKATTGTPRTRMLQRLAPQRQHSRTPFLSTYSGERTRNRQYRSA
ncbi:hypothetical protein L209DRAFT_266271 [Thermothelomyces heterothallicus CBS 203.75]